MSDLDLCTKRGNRITDKYVTYTLKDLKNLFDRLGLPHPVIKRKLQYCQKLDEYRKNHEENPVYMYKWSIDQLTSQGQNVEKLMDEIEELKNTISQKDDLL